MGDEAAGDRTRLVTLALAAAALTDAALPRAKIITPDLGAVLLVPLGVPSR